MQEAYQSTFSHVNHCKPDILLPPPHLPRSQTLQRFGNFSSTMPLLNTIQGLIDTVYYILRVFGVVKSSGRFIERSLETIRTSNISSHTNAVIPERNVFMHTQRNGLTLRLALVNQISHWCWLHVQHWTSLSSHRHLACVSRIYQLKPYQARYKDKCLYIHGRIHCWLLRILSFGQL